MRIPGIEAGSIDVSIMFKYRRRSAESYDRNFGFDAATPSDVSGNPGQNCAEAAGIHHHDRDGPCIVDRCKWNFRLPWDPVSNPTGADRDDGSYDRIDHCVSVDHEDPGGWKAMKLEKTRRWWKWIVLWIVGDYSQWYRRLLPVYGSWRKRQLEHRIRKEQETVWKRTLTVAMMLIFCIVWMLVSSGGGDPMSEHAAEKILQEGGNLVLKYGESVREIQVKPPEQQTIDGKTEEAILREARTMISREMLGNNAGWDHVSGPLYFPQQLSSGVYVYYETSDPQRISKQGDVDGIGAGKGIPVTVGVTMIYGGSVEQYTLQCRVVPPETPDEISQALQLRSEVMEDTLGQIRSGDDEALERILEGVELLTPPEKNQSRTILWMMMGLGIVVIGGRYSRVDQEREEKKRRLSEELPMVMDQLVLMMNAGLILTEAMELVSISEQETEGSLYRDLRFLCQRADEVRRPVTMLLCEYAVETGCSELVRFSTLLSDHVDRGSAALIQQLKMERNFAMESQWKWREERYRKMEVKLSGPLFLILGVILMITMSPVMIGL